MSTHRESRSYAVHPACEKCHRLYPMAAILGSACDLHGRNCKSWMVTACCGANQVDWKFLVGTRKGKINLTVRSRVAAVQKRGVWAALGM